MTFATQPAVLLPCPKCAIPMRTIERSGIHLETCPECRGVFLDRGELDRLLDLEAASSSSDDRGRYPTRGSERPDDQGRWEPERGNDRRQYRDDDDDEEDDDRRGRRSDSRDGGRRPSRRGSVLSDIFENFGG